MKLSNTFHSILLIFLFSFCASEIAFSQSANNAPLKFTPQIHAGNTSMYVIYQRKVVDPVLKEEKEFKNILMIKDSLSVFVNYGAYQFNKAADSIGFENIDKRLFFQLTKKYNAKEFSYHLLKQYNHNNLIYCNYAGMVSMKYDEPIPDMQWQKCEGQDTIAGYCCHKAMLSFRGRNWTAWYAPELKYSDGPWKFNGLPGLILKAVSEDGEQNFTACIVSFEQIPIVYNDDSMVQKTTRKKFNKHLMLHKTNANQTMAGLISNADNTPLQINRLFYSPEEKE
ncbi:MAG: GLPGLI family protein [Bacteroidales bacterium]|nr:GLPGLI family protein [Bacteroidales bacterium]